MADKKFCDVCDTQIKGTYWDVETSLYDKDWKYQEDVGSKIEMCNFCALKLHTLLRRFRKGEVV